MSKRVRPQPEPRYDDVYWAGLDSILDGRFAASYEAEIEKDVAYLGARTCCDWHNAKDQGLLDKAKFFAICEPGKP